MILALLVTTVLAKTASPSINCTAMGPKAKNWPVESTGSLVMNVPPGYEYHAIQTTSGSAGKWVRGRELGQRSINFVIGSRIKFQREYVAFTCTQVIHGRRVRVETGIGPTGRYFARGEWLEPLAGESDSYLVLWADTGDPAEQAEALAGIRTVEIAGKKGGA